MEEHLTLLQQKLFQLQDLKYREFHSKLVPTMDKGSFIGVRVPALRKLAKDFSKKEEMVEFLETLPHRYYEENNIHSYLIGEMKDYDEVIEHVNKFLPYVDNWATCDTLSPKVFKKNREKLEREILKWLESSHPYTVRFGIKNLMEHFLDEDYNRKYLEIVSTVKSEDYYVNMMVAWYFATALAKQYDDAVKYIEDRKLSRWNHNKTIQKAVESYRISKGQKEFLRTLRWK